MKRNEVQNNGEESGGVFLLNVHSGENILNKH